MDNQTLNLKGVVLRCEICGEEIKGPPLKLFIEGAELTVCRKCAKHRGKPATPYTSLTASVAKRTIKKVAKPVKKPRIPKTHMFSEDLEPVENLSEVVRQRREELGLTQEELAVRVGEKVSVIKRIESGRLTPPLSLIRKLEAALRVKLTEKPRVTQEKRGKGFKEFTLTLGDIMEVRAKKK